MCACRGACGLGRRPGRGRDAPPGTSPQTWCARATAWQATTTQDSGVGSRDTYPADALPATVAARRSYHCADARSLGGPRVPLRLPGEPAEEPRTRPSEPRLERGSNERASRPPLHETARRRDRSIKRVGGRSVRQRASLRRGHRPGHAFKGFPHLNASGL